MALVVVGRVPDVGTAGGAPPGGTGAALGAGGGVDIGATSRGLGQAVAQRVLGAQGQRNTPVAEALIKTTILKTPGVTGIVSIDTVYDKASRGVARSRVK